NFCEGVIATSCCIGAAIPQNILKVGEEKAEELLKWWMGVFGEDYYIELQRHDLKNIDNTGLSQEDINQILLKWAKKYNLKVIATTDSHYVDVDDFNAHDILLCSITGDKHATPVGIGAGKGFRFGFPNDQFYFKTLAEMNQLFADVPEALDFTNEIYDKIDLLELKRDILMPHFTIPTQFKTQGEYLRHLTYEGAKKHYGTISSEVESRINHELSIIENMGFPGYFLIVQDFINAARDIGVIVGPGRGSAAGSVVAYCTGITNIDPIQYNLLFERFLNPERISMPDIDVDFDDVGRAKVIDYVVDKYGKNQVAQIVTYGTMAAKMAIKDVARVLDLPLDETNKVAKLVPDKAGTKLTNAIKEVKELQEIYEGNDLRATVLKEALVLEGSVRGRGVHAAGVIIAPDDITNYVPVCNAPDQDSGLEFVTQFDGKVIEDAGMLKMDFLGLKTLTIIRDALIIIKEKHGVDIDIDQIPLDDPKTFELYQRGDTIGTFQFESDGMQMYLRQLKPTNIEDLIAMNALYRPGPRQFIPVYIDRKHGREQVEYAHPLLEPILKNTYGIMVYQEQIMQTAQVLAGNTLGGADLLRRAMGKKKVEEMNKQRVIFVKGAKEKNDIDADTANEIFDIMQRFAEYGFNRSHSAAYSVVAYQTAYLKANYPAEYMAAVLTHNMNNIEKITFFLAACKRSGLEVLGPDVNESNIGFTVNQQGNIRFGLAAIKGAGEAAVSEIIRERQAEGAYKDIFDFTKRINLGAVNKKTFESLAQAGAFDGFGIARPAYFTEEDGQIWLEKIIRYGHAIQAEENNAQQSLFGSTGSDVLIPPPRVPHFEPWGDIMKLHKEKEVVGFYISGHPLDQYELELKNFCTCKLSEVQEYKGKEITLGGIVSQVNVRQGKNGAYFTLFTIEDYDGTLNLALFGKDHVRLGNYIEMNAFLHLKGKVQQRYNNENQWEFRPQHIQLLSEVREQMTKGLLIRIALNQLDEALIERLEKLIEANPGKLPLQLAVIDAEENIQLDFLSRKYSISLDTKLFQPLTQIEGLQYELLSK
ncbi:MAG: DNA polymerase III subunit alpha, partial [Thermonemataceae bacterium]